MGFGEHVRSALGVLNSKVQGLQDAVSEIRGAHKAMQAMVGGQNNITKEMDSIPGRRVFYHLNGQSTFVLTDSGRRGNPITMLVSQDGPFVMTHYPMVLWRPSLPTNTTNFGMWRPVTPFPLPTQAVATAGAFDLQEDVISISWEMVSGGSQRNLQNTPTLPLLSRPDNAIPLPVPTLFTPNDSVQFIPTYQAIRFTGAVAPTQGILEVSLPGYRIVNM